MLLVVAALHISERRLVAYSESPYPVARTVPFASVRPILERASGTESYPLVLAFNSGETLSQALSGVGIDGAEAAEVVEELSRWADPRRIRPADQ